MLVAPEECLYISVSPPSPRGEDAPPNENPELVAGTADERNMLPPLGVPKAGVAAWPPNAPGAAAPPNPPVGRGAHA